MITARHMIWDKITNQINQCKSYFDAFHQSECLMQHVQLDINKPWEELAHKLEIIHCVIKFLTNMSHQALVPYGINDKTTKIVSAKRVYTKRKLI
jgi:hypothetical protein